MSEEEPILYEIRKQAAHITINRERRRNALTLPAIGRFLECLDRAEADNFVRTVQITGAGGKCFCAGADLENAVTHDASGDSSGYREYARLLKRISGFSKPTVARVKGYCLAGGMGVMLACDIVIADAESRFGTPEVNVGLFPMMIGALIYRNVLRKPALEMVLTGRMIRADEAEAIGLITRAVPPERLDETVSEILDLLAGKSPVGIRLGKEAFYAMQDMPFETALDFLSGRLGDVAATEDAREGIRAFVEKRQPQFIGR